jgi:hypothetical protein
MKRSNRQKGTSPTVERRREVVAEALIDSLTRDGSIPHFDDSAPCYQAGPSRDQRWVISATRVMCHVPVRK